jgi:hypothetical protein
MNDLERLVKERIEITNDLEVKQKLIKILFKVYRDLARLYTLRKE